MDYRDLMMAISDSYDDFVDVMSGWMERDASIRDAVLEQLRTKPNSNSSDILEVLCECLGIGEPLELVDDEYGDESQYVNTAARAAY